MGHRFRRGRWRRSRPRPSPHAVPLGVRQGLGDRASRVVVGHLPAEGRRPAAASIGLTSIDSAAAAPAPPPGLARSNSMTVDVDRRSNAAAPSTLDDPVGNPRARTVPAPRARGGRDGPSTGTEAIIGRIIHGFENGSRQVATTTAAGPANSWRWSKAATGSGKNMTPIRYVTRSNWARWRTSRHRPPDRNRRRAVRAPAASHRSIIGAATSIARRLRPRPRALELRGERAPCRTRRRAPVGPHVTDRGAGALRCTRHAVERRSRPRGRPTLTDVLAACLDLVHAISAREAANGRATTRAGARHRRPQRTSASAAAPPIGGRAPRAIGAEVERTPPPR